MSQTTLRVTTPTDREIHITRSFDAPRSRVWDTLTKPELLKRWILGPPGWAMDACEDDLRVGGAFRLAWRDVLGNRMTMHGVYRDIHAPERIVRTETLEVGCAGEAVEQLATLVLVEREGRTLLTLTLLFPSTEMRDATIASGMERGVAACYDRIDALLAGQNTVDPRLARNGALSYLEIPALDIRKSADFYREVLGWIPRGEEGDHSRFVDQSGYLIGRWVVGRAISREPGLLPFIYVDRVDLASEKVEAWGGTVSKTPYQEGTLLVAILRDPAGNTIGIWQDRAEA